MELKVLSRAAFLATAALSAASLLTISTALYAGSSVEEGAASPAAPAPVSQAEFQKVHDLVRPPDQETWRSIPWKTSLLEAVQVAAAQHKPLMMVTTNGHLLGCG